MQIHQVNNNPSLIEKFILFPVDLYRGNSYWIRPLDSDIEEVFDPKKNKQFRFGEAARWILVDNTGKTIGRIAAFFDKRLFKPGKPKVGGFGFFECIDSQDAANILFQTCEDWLKQHEVEAMDGSINFGDRDKNWGILLEGFDREPNYGMPYTHPYYKLLFETYGLQLFYNQLTFHRKVLTPLTEKLQEKYERIKKDPLYRFEHWDPKNPEIFIKAFTEIFNQAWAKHSGVAQMQEAHVRALFNKLKPVMDKRLLWFGFHGERPVCFFLMLPELNQFFKHVNGKLDVLGKIKFAYHRFIKGTHKIFGVIFGVVPDFQGKGLEGALIVACRPVVIKTAYRDLEMNWIGDFNPKMIHLIEGLGGVVVKKHGTYRLYFDRTFPFEREKMI